MVNIGGRYFDHFLKMFDVHLNSSAVLKKVVCLTDRDPERKIGNGKFHKCYPFEYGVPSDNVEYKNHSQDPIDKYIAHEHIRFFSQEDGKGKTFEYDLALHNSRCHILLTESMSNEDEIKEMMKLNADNTSADCLALLSNGRKLSEENERIKEAVEVLGDTWSEEDKIKAVIASRYLNSIGKGENALELAYALEENLTNNAEDFVVPKYIEEALRWICE